MSLAEQMLATMSVSEGSVSYLADEEPHIVINESRQALVPNELKTIAVTGDKDIETVTFDCVRYWDGYDLSTFAIYLNYVLSDMTTGTYIPKSITTSDGDKFYHFDWIIEKNITQKSGKISFAVTAVKTKQNESGETVVDKQWSSLPNGDCSIALGLNIENVPDNEETQNILSQMSAILEQIHADVDEWIKTSLVQEVGDSEKKAMSQKATTVAIEDAKSYSRSYTDDRFVELNADIQKNYQIAIRNSKRLTNIEQGVMADSFEVDDSVAYVKDVPTNALPYAAIGKVGGMTYKDGNTLKSAKVTEVKSVGANLFDFETWKATAVTDRAAVTYGDNSVTVSAIEGDAFIISEAAGVMVKGGETYTISFVESNTVIESVHYLFKNGKVDNSMKVFYGSPYTFVADADAEYYTVRFGVSNAGSTITFSNIKINKGSTAQPYTPYVEHTLPIPEAVRPANGINENVYDFIEWAEDGSVKQTDWCKKIVVDGSADEDWGYATEGLGGFHCGVFNNSSGNNVLSSRYSPRIYPWGEFETIGITKEGTLWICAPRTSIEEWRSQLANNPVEIIYELAEPIVTDISYLITADNLIGVEGGGTLTFENEYGYAVPSEVEYQVEV